MTSHCSVRRTITRTTRIHLVALLLTSTALVHATVAAAPEIYQKGDSWIESMSATRAAYRNWADEQEPNDADRKQALQHAWKQLRKSYPTQAGWFAADLGPQHLEWFDGSYSSKLDQAAISRALSGLGGDQAKLQQQLKHLQRMRVPTTDSRWLNLYSTICLLRDARVALDQVWCLDLRRQLAERLQTLVDADATVDDARWDDLRRQTTTIAEQMGSARPIDLAKLHESVALLKKRLPERFPDADRLLIQLEQQQGQWNATIAEAVTGKRLEAMTLAQLSDHINEYRRALVRNLAGMSEYLTVPAQEPLETEWEQDHATLVHDLGNRAYFARVASETYRPESLILETDRDVTDVVLRRAEALLDHLQQSLPAAELHELAEALQQLRTASESVGIENTEARYVLYADICRVRRQIAWKNPLLDFSDILFIKRHRALFNHMCDQYYGMAATPGGGLFVLENAFADDPHVRDVLAKSSVAEGRLKGRQLLGGPPTPPQVSFDGVGNRHGEDDTGGTFLSPDLSYDGSSVLFAYVENDGDRLHRHHIDPAQGHWDAGRCYHVFKVNLDGSDLQQLTDGTWNDFDPCWLPNGRIAFISERRGGYLRCGRVCPNYTLYDMAADGSDMTCLSFHETNEWHPAVSNDGMIIWTRWDYVDRHGCTAHMPWVTTLDGRNPRAVHGNFAPRPKRRTWNWIAAPSPARSTWLQQRLRTTVNRTAHWS